MAVSNVANWIDERTGLLSRSRNAVSIPGGARWRYGCPAVLAFLFGIEVLTGLLLWAAYSPSTRTAWESVFYIEHVMVFGSLVRGLHHYATHAMVVWAGLYLLQTVWDGSYRGRREVVYWLGLVMLGLLFVFSQTGYLLPWDQRGYTATQVATEIVASTPVVGESMQQLAKGGLDFGHHTLTRFFALHAGLLPLLFTLLAVARWQLVKKHGYGPRRDLPDDHATVSYWPDQAARDGVLCLMTLGIVAALAVIETAPLGPPADPTVSYEAARPEWWFLPVFRILHIPGMDTFVAAQGIPGAIFGALAILPFIDRGKRGRCIARGFVGLVFVALGGLLGLNLYEDLVADTESGRGFRASYESGEKSADRTVALALSPSGIPVEGAAVMLREDPLTQGPVLFAQYCSGCHAYNAHDGLGNDLAASPSAPDLGDFGSRKWIEQSLVAFDDQFAPLANVPEESEHAEAAAAILDGDMKYWSEDHREILLERPAELAALVEYLVAQSERSDVTVDESILEQGRTIFVDGTLSEDSEIALCIDCHEFQEVEAFGFSGEVFGEENYAPVLTGYGSTQWVHRMIADPGSHYGDNNAMPAFAKQLSESQISLLAKWLTGNFYREIESTEPVDR